MTDNKNPTKLYGLIYSLKGKLSVFDGNDKRIVYYPDKRIVYYSFDKREYDIEVEVVNNNSEDFNLIKTFEVNLDD